MTATTPWESLSALYERDETAWLEAMSELAGRRAVDELDYAHLSEYLAVMAKRDRREAVQRMTVLLIHLLKWDHQSTTRSRSWELTIREQRDELNDLLESSTLRNHARRELGKAYHRAVRRAAVETDVPERTFPAEFVHAGADIGRLISGSR